MAVLLHTIAAHSNDVNYCSFSSNSNILASVSGDKTVRLWNAVDGSEVSGSPLMGHSYHVTTCAFSPFGSMLATGSQDCSIILWDIATAKQLHAFQGHKGVVRDVSFSPNSLYMASASSDETVHIWEISSRALLRVLKGPEFSLMTCCFTPDNLNVVSGSVYGDLRIWDFNTGNCEAYIQAHDSGSSGVGISGADFSPTSGSADPVSNPETSEAPCFLLASCGGDNLVKLWNVYTGSAYSTRCHFEKHSVLEGHGGHVWDCKFSADGKLLASCSSDKSVILWNPEFGTIITKLSGHTRYITTVSFAPDSSLLATGSNDKTIQIWRITDVAALNFTQPLYQSKVSHVPIGDSVQPAIAEKACKRLVLWDMDEVCKWLEELGLQQYSEVFRANAIDGAELFQMTNELLANELGISPLGHRNKIMREIKTIKTKEIEGEIPDEFLCPITRELMSDPVMAADGFSYERATISSWITQGKKTSPMTNAPLAHTNLTPNRSLKNAIGRFLGPVTILPCV